MENVCMGKTPSELISLLGDRIFYVCPPDNPRNQDGTCIQGIVPYQLEEEGDNIKARNDWIRKYCGP
jgi:hypothetical protein